MKSFKSPQADLTLSSIVLGLMRIAKMSDADIRQLFDAAVDAGVTMIDHADIYGGAPHVCEARFGDSVKLSPADRERIMIQSKAGIRKGFFDFSSEHILEAVDGSLKALKTEYLDVLLLHRPDTLVEPDDVAKVFDQLHTSGKVRHFGVSNQTPGQIELLKSAVKQPLLFNQVQLSIPHANLFAQGIAANMDGLDQSISRDVGLLDYSRLKGMTLQAWSPVQHGFFEGVFIGDCKNFAELNDVMDELAKKYAVTPTGIAIAWITRHPANLQVVLGTTKPSRVRESVAGSDIVLTREEWYRLFRAAGHKVP
jgi:predicted oxidoreductase